MSITQSCPTLGDPTDCSPPGSSVPEIFQARILEWATISSSRGYCSYPVEIKHHFKKMFSHNRSFLLVQNVPMQLARSHSVLHGGLCSRLHLFRQHDQGGCRAGWAVRHTSGLPRPSASAHHRPNSRVLCTGSFVGTRFRRTQGPSTLQVQSRTGLTAHQRTRAIQCGLNVRAQQITRTSL